MRRGFFSALVLALGGSMAQASDLPSGQTVTLHEVLIDQVAPQTFLRFRFVAPAIARAGGTLTYETAADDMEHLCAKIALPYITEHALSGDLIVIALADRITEFGVANPDATQFIDAFRVENETCIWEAF